MPLFGPLFRKPFVEMPLGCFGKLPGYADFVRLDLDSKLSATLREWMMGAAPEGHPKETLSHGTRFFLNGGKKGLAGIVVGSEDSHARCFPFSAFVEVPIEAISRSHASALFAIESCWKQLESILRGLSPVPIDPPLAPMVSLGELYGAIRTGKVRIQRDAMESWRTESILGNTGVTPFAESLDPRRPESLFSRIRSLMTHLQSCAREDVLGEAFRIPYSFGQSYLVQAAFWLALIRARVKDLPLAPSWFSPIEPGLGNAGLWICFREVNGLDARVLLGIERTHDHLFDLTELPEDASAEPDPPTEAGLHTLEQLLRHVGSRS